MRSTTHSIIATVVLCIATVGYTRHMPDFQRFLGGANDFLQHYSHARLVGTGQMYDTQASYREQDRAVGFHVAQRYHTRLPWQAVLMAPLGWLPYTLAHWLWVCLNLAAFAALVKIWLLRWNYNLWGAISLPAAVAIVTGQDSLVLAFCLASVLVLARRGQDVAAGLLLAICTGKPQLFLLVPVALVAARRWRIVWSAVAGTAALLLIGTVAEGPRWVQQWMGIASCVADGMPGIDVALRPSIFQFGASKASYAAATALALACSLVIWRMRDLESGLSVAVLGSILVAPHTAAYDLPLLLVALPALPLAGSACWLRIALLTPVPYWALLRGAPFAAAVPVLLFSVVLASRWPRRTPESIAITGASGP